MASDPYSRPPSDPINPYAAPAADLADLEPVGIEGLAEAESIRRKYLNHEASIRSLGTLHYLAAFFGILGAFGLFVTLVMRNPMNRDGVPILWGALAFYVVLSALHLALGHGLRALKTWARWTEVVLVSISLVFVMFGVIGVVVLAVTGNPAALPGVIVYALGGLFSAYVLYLFVSAKGAMVFSPEYRAIIEKTPHVKYRTSLLVKIVLLVFVAVIALGVVAALMSLPR